MNKALQNTTIVAHSNNSLPQSETLLNDCLIKEPEWYPQNSGRSSEVFSEEEDINELIHELISYGLSPLPVAPVMNPYHEGGHKVNRGNAEKQTYDSCPLKDINKPVPLFTGKNPSCIKNNGKQHNINHRKYQDDQPSDKELKAWFRCVYNGVGSLGSRDIVWLDIDSKDFDSQEDCDKFFNELIARNNWYKAWQEQTGSGGYRVPVAVDEYPEFGVMAAVEGGRKIGEIRGHGSFAVLAPTLHPNGNYYRRLAHGGIPKVKNLESVGIYAATGSRKKTKQNKEFNGERAKCSAPSEKTSNELVNFLNSEVLPKLSVEQIYNWDGHQFQDYGNVLKGHPYGRESYSGTSFHVWFDGSHWAWQDKATGVGGGAVQYRWMLKGGSGTPRGRDYVDIVKELAEQAGVKMPEFQRTEKNGTTKRDIDAIYEKLTSIDVAECSRLGVKVIRINKEFLTSADLGLEKGKITIVKSAKGTAKTKSLVAALKEIIFDAIASWHTRISLAVKMAEECGLDFKPEKKSLRQSFCANSSYKFHPNNLVTNGLFIGDEFDQIMQYVFEDLCNNKNQRPTILRYLEAHLKAALFDGSVLLMSEDITQKEINFIRALLPEAEIEVVINEYQPRRGNLHFSNDKDCTGLLKVLLEKIQASIPCFVVDDLKDGVFGGKSIAQYVKEKLPNVRLKIINSETSAQEVDFIANINEQSKDVDVIVCSPSITAGVSLENGRFDNGVFLFANGIFDANAASQALGRVRGAKQTFVWTTEEGFNYEESRQLTPEKVDAYYQELEVRRTSIIHQYNVFYDPLVGEFTSPYWTLFCENAAMKNISMAFLRKKIKAKLIKDGYNLVEVNYKSDEELRGNREQGTLNREIPIIKIRGFKNGRLFSCAPLHFVNALRVKRSAPLRERKKSFYTFHK